MPPGSCSSPFKACWDIKVRRTDARKSEGVGVETTQRMRESAEPESIWVGWTGHSPLHTKDSCCLKPTTEEQCPRLSRGGSRREPGSARPRVAVLCPLCPGMLLQRQSAKRSVLVAEGRKTALWEPHASSAGRSDPRATHPSGVSSCGVKAVPQLWLRHQDADIRHMRA